MTDETYKKLLEKQQYALIGEHSAVKICTWTKKALRDQGCCYKEQFYGIKSHKCCQISVTINYCDMDCIYCWREHYNARSVKIDEPKQVIENAISAQKKLLSGFGGNKKVDLDKLKEAQNPKHFAISLTGETLYYPKLNELIKLLQKKNMTSFVVTNGQLPEVLKSLESPTQLYVSIDSPNKEVQKKMCKPKHKDSWERLMKSLEVLKELKEKYDFGRGGTRTALRITLIKGLNMIEPENYAALIQKAKPHFAEVKAYMFVGASRLKLSIENMPIHKEVKEFSEQISKLSGYKIIDEQEASRVVLLMKQDFKERIMTF